MQQTSTAQRPAWRRLSAFGLWLPCDHIEAHRPSADPNAMTDPRRCTADAAQSTGPVGRAGAGPLLHVARRTLPPGRNISCIAR